jgi:VCBS repeat-containing protein
MKKLISTLAFVLGVVALSFAQDVKNTAVSQGATELANSKMSGTYVYTLPEGTTDEQVTKAASYYTDYFTVSYDASSREATVNITGETSPSSQVMLRFLSGCGVMYVDVDGESHQLNLFYADYVK